MEYKISLIIPVFNVEDYISKTLDSIISQTIGFENLEVIMVDDKSTDNSAEIMRKYSERFDNIKAIYLDKGSGFAGKPRNVGLKHATSPYIMFLDSDDYLESSGCERLYETITEEDADIVCGSFTSKGKNGVRKFNRWLWVSTFTSPKLEKNIRIKEAQEIISKPNFKIAVTDLDENPEILGHYNVWAKIYRKSLIEDNDIEFPEDIVAQDSVFLLESFFNAEKIVFIKDIIVHYRDDRKDDGNTSLTHAKSKRNLCGRIKAYDLMNDLSIRFLKEEMFDNYLLGPKLTFWYDDYLLNTQISSSEIEDIFRQYSHLFSKCYQSDISMSEDTKNVFKEIHESNYKDASEMVLKSKEKQSGENKKNTKSVIKRILKKN